jgi:hypothetical protein
MKLPRKIFFIAFIALLGSFMNAKADTIDNYQIYVGNVMVIAGSDFYPARSANFLKLDSSNFFETLNINYSHCTAGARGRQLKLADTADRTILMWEFGDKREHRDMSIPISEILSNPAIKNNRVLRLYYTDKESPGWRLLTSILPRPLKFEKAKRKDPE